MIITGLSLYKASVMQPASRYLSLGFNWAPRHEGVLGEWMYSSIHSLISALDGGEWLFFTSHQLYHQSKLAY